MKEIRKVLEWIENKFRKTTKTAPEPVTLWRLYGKLGMALEAMDDAIAKTDGETTDVAPEPPQEANDRPTTVIGWLETLPDGYRELAINNMIEHRGIYECDSASMALFMSSTWLITPEGQEFWSMVYGWLNGQSSVSELPPLPQPPPNDPNDPKFRIASEYEIKPMRGLNSPVEPMSDKTMDAISDMFKSMSNHATQLRTLTSMSIPSFSRDLLEQELLTCIATENYERCAEIKVQLDKLNKVND